jgi:hypothetical protein
VANLASNFIGPASAQCELLGEEEEKVYAVDENVGAGRERRVKESERGSRGLFSGEQERECEGE